MAVLPERVRNSPRINCTVEEFLLRNKFKRVNRGKVRDTYEMPNAPTKLAVVASDRLSIFDFVLPAEVPGKGEILTALTYFWLTTILSELPSHLVPSSSRDGYNAAIDKALLLGSAFPVERTLVVNRLVMQPYELIFRRHPGGSVWKAYESTGIIAGQQLPAGLQKWQRLPEAIFTPSTKEDVGHDVNITAQAYFEATGGIGRDTIEMLGRAYAAAYEFALKRGIVLLDSKFEVAAPPVLADELLTPDSSRYVELGEFEQAQQEGRDPRFLDKEEARIWGRTVETPWGVGLQKLNPEDAQHVDFVHNKVSVPVEVIDKLIANYHRLFFMLTGHSLKDYQREQMGIGG